MGNYPDYEPRVSWDLPERTIGNLPTVLVVSTAGSITVAAGIGTVVYAKRRDWIRFTICLLAAMGGGWLTIKAIQESGY